MQSPLGGDSRTVEKRTKGETNPNLPKHALSNLTTTESRPGKNLPCGRGEGPGRERGGVRGTTKHAPNLDGRTGLDLGS